MFSSQMLVTLLLLLGLSVITRESSLFLLSLALLVAAGASRLWERYALARVEYRRCLGQSRAFFGQEIDLEIEVVNRKVLPLSWLEIEDELPADLPLAKGRTHPSHKPGKALLAAIFALRPYERIRRRYRLACSTRGEHAIGPARMMSGDLFGFVSTEKALDHIDTLVVCPRIVPIGRLSLPGRTPLGDVRRKSWIFEDTSRIAGARDYRPEDGLRRIHWPASVRAQRLQSRVYEATTSRSLAIFLNVSTNEGEERGYGYDPDLLEMSIVAAASIAHWGIEQGHQVGAFANGSYRGHDGSVVVPVGREPGQRERVLVALGRLKPLLVEPIESLLAREGSRLPYGSSVILVAAGLTPSIGSALLSLGSRGHATTALLTGRRSQPVTIHGVPVYRVGPQEDWREIQELVPWV